MEDLSGLQSQKEDGFKSPEKPIIEYAKLADLEELEGEGIFSMREMIELFDNQGRQIIASLHQALEARSAKDLEREGHTLKGSGRELGALRLAEICQQVETRGKTLSFDGVEGLLVQVEEEFERACAELANYLERKG